MNARGDREPGGPGAPDQGRSAAAPVRVIGLGSPFGDDALGWQAVAALGRLPLPSHVTLRFCRDPAVDLLPALRGAQRAVLVDAVVDGGPAGRVTTCDRAQLADAGLHFSSHGIGVPALLDLADALGDAPAELALVGISMAEPAGAAPGLSPQVAAALPALLDAIRTAAGWPVPTAATCACLADR